MNDVLSDPRAFLSAVVNSADPSVSIRERLDALKLLEGMGGLPRPEIDLFAREAYEMPQSEIDNWTDAQLCDVVRGIAGHYPFERWEPFGDPAERFPQAVDAIKRQIEAEAKRLSLPIDGSDGAHTE